MDLSVSRVFSGRLSLDGPAWADHFGLSDRMCMGGTFAMLLLGGGTPFGIDGPSILAMLPLGGGNAGDDGSSRFMMQRVLIKSRNASKCVLSHLESNNNN